MRCSIRSLTISRRTTRPWTQNASRSTSRALAKGRPVYALALARAIHYAYDSHAAKETTTTLFVDAYEALDRAPLGAVARIHRALRETGNPFEVFVDE